MACEKVGKAYSYWQGNPPNNIQSSHVSAAKYLPMIARQLLAREDFSSEVPHAGPLEAIRRLAREVERLAPAVKDDKRRPDNCEYPWLDDRGDLVVPAEHEFKELGRIHMHEAGTTFLKIVTTAAEELAEGYYTS